MKDIPLSTSNAIKGIAILLMLFHHLFAFPERTEGLSTVSDLGFVADFLSVFGKICVPVYIFLSGYGFFIIGAKRWSYYRNKVLAMLFSCWLVLFLFLPLGFIFSPDKYMFDLNEFVANLLLIKNSYNYEWWFVQPYIFMVLFLPALNYFRGKPLHLVSISIVSIFIFFVSKYYDIDTPIYSLQLFLFWWPVFILGFSFSIIMRKLEVLFPYRNIVGFNTICVFVLFAVFYYKPSILVLVALTPFFVCMLRMVLEEGGHLTRCLQFLGKNSLYIWLTHSFYCYYIFSGYVFFFEGVLFPFLMLIILSLISSMFLVKLENTVKTIANLKF